MTQCWNCLTQVWNWNRLLLKDIFRDEIELFFKWKWMKKVWKTLGKPILEFWLFFFIPHCTKKKEPRSMAKSCLDKCIPRHANPLLQSHLCLAHIFNQSISLLYRHGWMCPQHRIKHIWQSIINYNSKHWLHTVIAVLCFIPGGGGALTLEGRTEMCHPQDPPFQAIF